MIIVSVQLLSAVDGQVSELARMTIDNIGGTQQRGDYRVRTLRGRSAEALHKAMVNQTAQREATVLGHRRLAEHVWNLVAKALASMRYGEAEVVRPYAQFLCDRLDELDFSMSADDFAREYAGHVDPALSRLKGALLDPPASEEDAFPYKEALHDLVALHSEEWALNGGGPGIKERWKIAWAIAEDLVSVEP